MNVCGTGNGKRERGKESNQKGLLVLPILRFPAHVHSEVAAVAPVLIRLL